MDGQNESPEQLTEQQAQEELAHLRRLFSRVRLLRKDVLENLAARCRANVPSDCFFSSDPQGMCDHCVSACAYRDHSVHNKLETVGDTVWQCMAKYVVVDGAPCVIEMATELDQDFLNSFSGRGRLLDQLTFYHDKIYTDVLTGVYNRRYYEEQIRDTNLYAGIAMMDADDFKLYNDLYGHNVGDAVLRTMVNAISGCLRKSDMLIRYGGDEFLLIIPSVSSDSFLNVLNRIRQRVSNAEVSGFPRIHLSVSIGAVECKNEPVEQAVHRADEIMLLAKNKKNRICTEEDLSDKELMAEAPIILLVDDSKLNREILSAMLHTDFRILEAEDVDSCIAALKQYGTNISLVLLDIVMPGKSGFDALIYMNDNHLIDDIPVMTITEDASAASVRRAYDMGVSDYINRPFDSRVVSRRVHNTIRLYAKQSRLISLINRRIIEKDEFNRVIVNVFSHAIEFHDLDSSAHVLHISKITALLLEQLLRTTDRYPLSASGIETIVTVSVLHDIGKIGIPPEILCKPGKLSAEEFEIVKKHTVIGAEILDSMNEYRNNPLVKTARQICRWHHERYDGSGYPDGLSGDDIPISAQVVSLADVYDALVSKRVYKDAYTHDEAYKMIMRGDCGVFNPILLRCLEQTKDKIADIY